MLNWTNGLLLAVAAYIAVSSLVRLMRARYEELADEIEREATDVIAEADPGPAGPATIPMSGRSPDSPEA